jgi:hypothetical protein
MHRLVTVCVCAVAAAACLVGPPPPAGAAPAYVDDQSELYDLAYVGEPGLLPSCTETSSVSPTVATSVSENGPRAQRNAAVTGTFKGALPTQSASVAASATGEGSLASIGGLPRSADLTFSGQVSVNLLAKTEHMPCTMEVLAGLELHTEFSSSQPLWLHLDMTSTVHGWAAATVYRGAEQALYTHAFGFAAHRQQRVYLPPGQTALYLTGEVGAETNQEVQDAASGAVHATFTVPGATTRSPQGRAGKYLTLPGSASCASHSVDATATRKRKRVAQIKKVRLFVDDQPVSSLKHVKKGAVVPLAVPAGSAPEVRVEVTLAARHGHRSKTLSATAAYEACA